MLARWSGTLYYIYAESIISHKDFVAVGNTMHLQHRQDFLKYHTYIVARDFLQISGENFMKTFTLVAKFATLYIYLALVAYLNWDLE